MYLPPSDEQRMLGESAARYLGKNPCPGGAELARLGWLAAAFSEDLDGLGGAAADIAPVCEAIGAAGAQLPYFASVLLPAALLRHVDDGPVRRQLVGRVASGKSTIAVAHTERGPVFDAEADCACRGDPAGRLSGNKRRVWNGQVADCFIVTAGAGDQLGLYVIEASSPGVEVRTVHEDSGMDWADVSLQAAPALVLQVGEAARGALAAAAAFALVGTLAETVGLMTRIFEDTRAWLRTRRQFGKALSENQVLQHRLVDMFIACEEARSMLNLAIHLHDGASPGEQWRGLAAAKVHIAQCARMVGQSGVHLHGAMGITEELWAARAYRRIEALTTCFGGADLHLHRYAMAQQAASATGTGAAGVVPGESSGACA